MITELFDPENRLTQPVTRPPPRKRIGCFPIFLGIMALLIAYAFYWWFVVWPATTIRYRIDADFEVAGKSVHASGIWEVQYASHNSFNGALKGMSTRVNAEAPFAELGDGRRLFLRVDGEEMKYHLSDLKTWNQPDRLPLKLLGQERGDDVEAVLAVRHAAGRGLSYAFGFDLLPKMWLLPVPNDLTSLYEPEVCEPPQDCEVRFIGGRITFVNERPTTGLKDAYPQLHKRQGLWTKERMAEQKTGVPATSMFITGKPE